MPSKYFTILTNIGSALHANAQIQQTKVPWTHMALGDGGGVEVQPDQKQTALVREVHRLPITAIDPHPANPNWIVVEAVVPNNVGGWTVRETAIYGGTGVAQCIAVGNYPASYKPVLAEGAVREMVMRMIVEISSTATVNLVIDPAVAIASRQFVEEFVCKELQKLDNKQSVRVATTANIVLSGLQSVDGIALAAGDRVLVKDQASGKDNGIYTAAAGAWSRAVDADTSAKVTPQLFVGVEQGAVNADSVWMLTTDAPIVLGTTPLVFEVSGGRPLATKAWVQSLTANEIQAGIMALADKATAEAGVDSSKALSPLRALQLIRAAVANATEVLRGALRIGTQSEVNEGTDDAVAVTPKKLRFGFTLVGNGVVGAIRFPDWLGKFQIAWGGTDGNNGASTFALAFSQLPRLAAFPAYFGGSAPEALSYTPGYHSVTTTGFGNWSSGVSVSYIAVGLGV